jgi:hypothetical protein
MEFLKEKGNKDAKAEIPVGWLDFVFLFCCFCSYKAGLGTDEV